MENLARIGRLRPHAATRDELERLLEAARRALADAATESLGPDARFGLAYRAIQQAATAAMLARGFRAATSEPGHQPLLLQSLPQTAGLDPARVPLLEAFRAARDRIDYAGDAVSSAVAWECVEEAREVVRHVRARLEATNSP